MSGMQHNAADGRIREQTTIGVRALLSAGEHRPEVALSIPGTERQIRLSAEEAAALAGRLLTMADMARYDAAVYAALAGSSVTHEVREAILTVLIAAREHITDQHRRHDEEWRT